MRNQNVCLGLAGLSALPLLLAVGSASAADAAGRSWSVAADRDRVSIHVVDAPLGQLLTDLGRRTGVVIRVVGDPPAVSLSVDLDDLELWRALQRLLSDQSYVLIDRGPARHTIEIRLLGTRPAPAAGNAGPSVAAAGRLEERSVEDLMALALSSEATPIRAAAIDAVAYAAAGDSARMQQLDQTFRQLLADPDAAIRSQVLATLKDTADRLPIDAIDRVAHDDPAPALRRQALELLVERDPDHALERLRSAAASDPAPSVRERARELGEEVR